ncbi:hypothetical protein DQ04_12731010 [Trypanosoma grayi]|uniref:hypothetical protein n=1 Tax=Trypanosoma grayi TaxID=71804 RepID=UPI0004F4A5B8|nr:hypothetical protein DQ04_12731010 [Trypanosoma grayi]KEG06692.1 hypothetical protein DQ04_12731010 [Trypanosoma grayi]
MAEKLLKEKVSNMEQFERALKRAQPVAYLAFYDAFQQQTQVHIPLPSPSVWHYEGERRKQWAERFIPISHEAQQFFENVLAADVKKSPDGAEKVLQKVAAVLEEVGKVLVRRHQRRLGGRAWSALSDAEKDVFCAGDARRVQLQVETGDFDPPEDERDVGEAAAEWKSEHDAIMELITAPIDGLGFTAQDFWRCAVRCEEMETEHIHAEERARAISAAARKALYNTTSFDAVVQGAVDAVARGKLDMSAGVLVPHFNDVWCQLNYAKFGAATVTQHTTTARRQLFFHHSGSLKEVAATATLYYATKPLSSSLDYASPYKFRRSLLALCSTYGVEMAHATQRPLLLSAAHLARAEDLMRTIVTHAARPFGERRRAALERLRVNHERLAVPVRKVLVTAPNSDLLASGKELSESAANTTKKGSVTMWPLGARRALSYDWQTPHLQKLKAVTAAAGATMTAQHVKEIHAAKQRAFVEVSLWRRVTPEEVKQRRETAEAESKWVADTLRSVPQLRQVQQYATSLYQRVGETLPELPNAAAASAPGGGGGGEESASGKDDDTSTWEFAVMLDDRATLNMEQVADLYLPYADANGVPLPQGEYRVRVRCFDLDMNPNHNPALCSEAFSASLQVFDAMPQLIKQFFTVSKKGESEVPHIPASDFIPFCEFLREAGLDVPLRCEFEAGQALTAEGDVFMDYFQKLLRSDEFHRSCAQAGVTDAQREIEPSCRAHWEVHHPGANEAEWAEARRHVLDRAMQQEREWWFPNDMLDVQDIATGSSSGHMASMYPATMRYGTELCTVLTAEGRCDSGSGLSAKCEVNGTGGVESLTISSANCSSSMISIDEALSVAQRALRGAHDRHNTLSAFRLGPLVKQAQVMVFCGINAFEFGGKYARSYVYAFGKAKKELANTAVSGRVVLGVGDEDVERVSDKEGADRFASTTHPEQRKKLFVARVGPGAVPIDDPTPEQKSEWGR